MNTNQIVGAIKSWTPEDEAKFQRWIDSSPSFPARYVAIEMRNSLKWDLRTRVGQRAIVMQCLMLAVSSDKDLEDIAMIRKVIGYGGDTVEEQLAELRKEREDIRMKGMPWDFI